MAALPGEASKDRESRIRAGRGVDATPESFETNGRRGRGASFHVTARSILFENQLVVANK